MKRRLFTAAAVITLAAACSNEAPKTTSEPTPDTPVEAEQTQTAAEEEASIELPQAALNPDPAVDKFTYSNYNDVRVTNVALDLDVLFDEKMLDGLAVLDFDFLKDGVSELVLDTNSLTIKSVEAHVNGEWAATGFTLGNEDDDAFGSSLTIFLPGDADKVRIAYRTDPGAGGLQWLSPEQTASGDHPFLFSQNQPVHARSMAPLQDTPAVRMTYSATLRTPPELLAIMSASQDPDGELDGEYTFEMPQPIPSYLLALAIGDIKFKAISDNIGVYAEEFILEDAAKEFEDTPAMEEANVRLYGPYLWGRFDMIVLPPSFPFGGMENPRLTFLTPTLIAGDKSLTNVVAHELAHSWSGNLITNSTWRDAWLNEGFTSYVENRIMEDLYGERRATMERALDLESLKRDIAEAERPETDSVENAHRSRAPR